MLFLSLAFLRGNGLFWNELSVITTSFANWLLVWENSRITYPYLWSLIYFLACRTWKVGNFKWLFVVVKGWFWNWKFISSKALVLDLIKENTCENKNWLQHVEIRWIEKVVGKNRRKNRKPRCHILGSLLFYFLASHIED